MKSFTGGVGSAVAHARVSWVAARVSVNRIHRKLTVTPPGAGWWSAQCHHAFRWLDYRTVRQFSTVSGVVKLGVVFLASAALLFLVTWGAEWSVLLVFPVTVVAFLLAPDAVGGVPVGWFRRRRYGDRDVAGQVTKPGDVVVFYDGRAGVWGSGVVWSNWTVGWRCPQVGTYSLMSDRTVSWLVVDRVKPVGEIVEGDVVVNLPTLWRPEGPVVGVVQVADAGVLTMNGPEAVVDLPNSEGFRRVPVSWLVAVKLDGWD